MNHLIVTRKILFVLLALVCGLAYGGMAHAGDNLYVFVFKDGQAQQNITIRVGDVDGITNEYGLANFSLPADDYEISYYRDGKLFALTDLNLLQGQQSQVFLNLTRKGADVDLDLPMSAYTQDFEQTSIKKQTGPKGVLKLKITDAKSHEPIAGARLFFKGYAVEANTDANGVANVDLSDGTYDISVVHPKYIMNVMKDVTINADSTSEKSLQLVKADIVMDDYVVTAPAVEGSLASTFTALKDSSVISDALSSEEFNKSGDSSAADALKRVTGITLVDDKYVYVRGLGERYSVVLVNDLYVPSTEPTKRVVPLDIFPSSVIQSMFIQKTYSADLPGTFAGGDVLIQTKDIPEEDNYVKLTAGVTYNSHTGEEVVNNPDNDHGLPADVIKKSSDFQEIQRGFPNLGVPGYTPEELYALNSAMANYRRYNLGTTTLEPGHKIELDIGQSFKTSGGLKYGFVGTLYASTDNDATDGTKYNSFYDQPTGVLTAGERSDYQQATLNDKQSALFSFGLDTQKGNKLKYTFLILNDTDDITTFSEKDGGPAGPGIDDQQRTFLQYVEKELNVHQLSGEHHLQSRSIKNDLFNDIKISWGAETATATRYEPGSVEYVYEKTSNVTDYTLDKKIFFLYSDLHDELDNYRLDLTLPYKHNKNDNRTSFGVFVYKKSRTLDNRRFKVEHGLGTDVFTDIDNVFTQENVDNGDLVLTSNYRPDDAYSATQDVTAFYINQLFSITHDLDLFAGIRKETSEQQLIDSKSGEPYDPLETDDLLASLSLNYNITNKQKLRLAFANTLSRPDFREFSPNRFKDPITEDIVFGYPDLEYTTIDNIDLKYEWYMSYDEVFSVGLFQKDFTNPVETIVNQDPDSQTGKKIITFRNALGATSSGIEFNFRKRLGFFGKSFDNYFISGNFAKIKSNIRLDENSTDPVITALTSKDRPMQGQSPYVANLSIGYDNINTGRSAILAYNEFGERIVALGSFGAPDYYENPYRKLDFIVKWQLNDTYDFNVKKIGYALTFKASNILDSEREITQGDTVTESVSPGREFKVSFSIKY